MWPPTDRLYGRNPLTMSTTVASVPTLQYRGIYYDAAQLRMTEACYWPLLNPSEQPCSRWSLRMHNKTPRQYRTVSTHTLHHEKLYALALANGISSLPQRAHRTTPIQPHCVLDIDTHMTSINDSIYYSISIGVLSSPATKFFFRRVITLGIRRFLDFWLWEEYTFSVS